MRCIACRPLLEGFLAGHLRPRQAYAVRGHLKTCAECAALLEETKIVDALLSTSAAVNLPADFTGAAMDQVRAMPAPRRKHPAAWAFVIIYLAAAWFAGFVWLALTGQSAGELAAAIVRRSSSFAAGLGSLAGSGHIFGRNASVVLAFGLGVLFLDVAFLLALLVVYRVLRPRLAAHVSATPEVS